MSSPVKPEVSERFAEMERMDRRRVWESALKPLTPAAAPEFKPETISVPVDVLIRRLDELERSILNVHKEMQVQVATLHHARRRGALKIAGLILTIAALATVFPRVVAMVRSNPLANAGFVLED